MKLIGVTVLKNEAWVLGMSLRAAMQWLDEIIVVDDCSWDGSHDIIKQVQSENPWRVHYSRWYPTKVKVTTSAYDHTVGGETVKAGTKFTITLPDPTYEWWDEMDMRQHSLLLARKHGATHVAIVDADEVVTANVMRQVRMEIEKLEPATAICYPMIPVWGSLDEYRSDDCVWSRSELSIAFADSPELSWKQGVDGYHHHHRLPYGIKANFPGGVRRGDGGVMHFQFSNRRRLVSKHVYYRMNDHLRHPGRDTPDQLNAKYDQALQENGIKMATCPKEWFSLLDKSLVNLDEKPWYDNEIKRMIEKHGREAFSGLDLKAF